MVEFQPTIAPILVSTDSSLREKFNEYSFEF